MEGVSGLGDPVTIRRGPSDPPASAWVGPPADPWTAPLIPAGESGVPPPGAEFPGMRGAKFPSAEAGLSPARAVPGEVPGIPVPVPVPDTPEGFFLVPSPDPGASPDELPKGSGRFRAAIGDGSEPPGAEVPPEPGAMVPDDPPSGPVPDPGPPC